MGATSLKQLFRGKTNKNKRIKDYTDPKVVEK
jgi:hypothetical protein